MKTKIRQMSKRTLAVFLGLMMLVTSIGLGSLITANATTYYAFYDTSGAKNMSSSTAVTMTAVGDGTYYCSFTTTNSNFSVTVCTNNPATTASCCLNTSTTKGTTSGVTIHNAYQEGSNYYWTIGWATSGTTVYFIYNPSTNVVSASTSAPSGGGSTPDPDPDPSSIGTEVTDDNLKKILNGTDVSFYIESYTDKEWADLCSSSKATPSYSRYGKIGSRWGKIYVQVAKTALSTYYRITNNKSDWNGDENTAIKTAVGGEHFVKGGSGNVASVGSNTTINATYRNTDTMTIQTTSNNTKTAFTENSNKVFDMKIKYYIKSGTDYYYLDGKDINASTSAQSKTYSLSGLAAGSYTLITLAEDSEGYVRYIADTDDFTVTVEPKHSVTFTAGTGGSISPNTATEVGEETATTVTATANEGYRFSSWTNGTGITQVTNTASGDNQTQTITTKSTGTYTVQANFTKKSYTLSYSAATGGTFTVTKTSGGTSVATGSSIVYETGITVTATPDTGYTLSSVTYGPSGTGTTASGTGNTRTFSMPASNTQIKVTFTKKNNSISTSADPSGGGSVWIGAAANTAYASKKTTYKIGDTVYLRANANDAYNFDHFVLTYGDGTTQTFNSNSSSVTLNSTHYGTGTGAISLTGYFTAKKTYAITTKSNNNRLGTISVSPSSAYAGQTVTATFTNLSGTITSSSAKDADDGTVSLSGSNTSTTRTFTMPAKAVTVTGNFTLYTGTTNFYYNGYDSNANEMTSNNGDKYGKQMSEGMVNGKKFAYYHVTGRTETDQLFTVSYGNPTATGTVFLRTPNKSWNDGHGWKSDPQVAFYSSDGAQLKDWQNMEWDKWWGNENDSDKVWKKGVPYGAQYVQFRGTSNDTNNSWPYSAYLNLASMEDYKDGWALSGSGTNNGQYNQWEAINVGNQKDIIANGYWENFNGEGKYTNNFSTSGFNEHKADHTAQHKYNKPNGLDASQRGDYYIIALYNGETYTINGETHTIDKNPEIIWSPTLPGGIETVTVYAKDGTVRWSGDSPTTTNGKLGDTVITNNSTNYPGVSNITSNNGTGNASDCNYQTAKVEKGMKFQVTTTVESEFRSTHYVKAFMVNGKGYKFFTHSNNGVYTMEYTVPEEFDGKTIEITPVYFLKDESDTVTFKIDGFDPTIQTTGKWGTTLYAYPFYAENVSGYQSAFYGYPGQPIVEDNGKYYIQIPIHNTNPADTNHTTVRGITLSNGYLDDVHKVCESTYVTDHRQTYDYDDFYKIYNEKHPDNITFSFKYTGTDISNAHTNVSTERTAGHNPGASFTNKNTYTGWEDLKNYHGQRVNIFGEVLDNQNTTNVLYVVSDGYWYNNAGSFGTEWNVYTASGSTFTRRGTIVPSALTLNNADSFDKDAYAQYNDSSHNKHMLSSFKSFYNTLKSSYNNYRVEISYEHNILGGHYERYNVVKSQNESGDDAAYRLDGRWTYSNDDDIINANIQIRYLDLTHSDIKDSTADTFGGAATSSADKPVGDTTGAVAYFTNSDLNQAGQSYQNKMATGNVVGNKNKEFTFTTAISTPKTNNYVFQGWYLLKDGKYSPMSKASSPMNATETYVALYRQSSDSTITVSHNLMSGSGAGLTEVKLEVTGSTNSSYDKVYDFSADPITATIDTGSTVIVTLSSTSAGANTFNGWYNSDGTLLDNGGSDNGTVVKGAAKQVTLTSSDLFTGATPKIRSKEYLSDFHNVTRNFKAVFHYTNRAGQSKTYTVKTVLDTYYVAANPTTSLNSEISEGVTLKQWVKDNAPSMIDLYGKNIKWTMTDAAMTSGFNAAQNKIDIYSTTEIKTWNIVVETHSDGNVNNASTKHIDTKSNIPNNTYAEKSAGVYYTPDSETYDKFAYWSVFPLDLKTGEPKNNNELLRIYNYEFKVMITGNYYVKAIYTPGTVTKASVQEAVYSREVYDLDETGDTKKDDLYSDFIYSYMSERNSVELKNNSDYLSGLAVEVSQGTKVPEGTSKAVDYSEYTFVSDNSNIESYVAAITASTANGAKIGSYTYTADGKSDKRSVYCYPISNSNYNNFNRGDFAIMYGSNQSWTKYIMKAYYYVKNTSTGTVQISEPVYFCLHNTKVTVFASSNTIVES